ncbi:SRPBCC family protein [Spongiimicrobium sp. 3-5]|uniref:SRPBCC family protein n=1 Tax=Spongiimicrobium sp. 3-5 TaxID=3332596 RepID=UPI003980EED8
MTKTSDISKRTLTLKRTFNAPISLVWEAWTQPQHIAQWWGPKGMETRVIEHNFEVGGQWKYAMTMPDGKEFIAEGVYSEIVALEKIISSADFKPMTEGVEIQALFQEDGDKTHFTFNCVHATEEYCKQQEQMGFYNGWGSVFERLAAHLNDPED